MTDAQQIRERLAEDGHREVDAGAGAGAGGQHLLRHRRGGRQVAQGGAAGGAHGRAGVRDRLRGQRWRAAFDGHGGQRDRARAPLRAGCRRVSRTASARSAAPGWQRRAFARTRAYVKIQDGCSFGCSYCVIPQVRGASRSRAAAAVLHEAARRAGQGHRELVLTGVNLGCFRDRAAGLDLAGLLAGGGGGGRRRARAAVVDRGQPPERPAAARRSPTRRRRPPPARADAVRVGRRCCGRCAGATRRPAFLAKMLRARELVPGHQPHHRRDRRPPGRGRRGVRADAGGGARGRLHARCTSSPTRRGRARPTRRRSGAGGREAPALARASPAVGRAGRAPTGGAKVGHAASWCWSRASTAAGTATTTRRSSSSARPAGWPTWRRDRQRRRRDR